MSRRPGSYRLVRHHPPTSTPTSRPTSPVRTGLSLHLHPATRSSSNPLTQPGEALLHSPLRWTWRCSQVLAPAKSRWLTSLPLGRHPALCLCPMNPVSSFQEVTLFAQGSQAGVRPFLSMATSSHPPTHPCLQPRVGRPGRCFTRMSTRFYYSPCRGEWTSCDSPRHRRLGSGCSGSTIRHRSQSASISACLDRDRRMPDAGSSTESWWLRRLGSAHADRSTQIQPATGYDR